MDVTTVVEMNNPTIELFRKYLAIYNTHVFDGILDRGAFLRSCYEISETDDEYKMVLYLTRITKS